MDEVTVNGVTYHVGDRIRINNMYVDPKYADKYNMSETTYEDCTGTIISICVVQGETLLGIDWDHRNSGHGLNVIPEIDDIELI